MPSKKTDMTVWIAIIVLAFVAIYVYTEGDAVTGGVLSGNHIQVPVETKTTGISEAPNPSEVASPETWEESPHEPGEPETPDHGENATASGELPDETNETNDHTQNIIVTGGGGGPSAPPSSPSQPPEPAPPELPDEAHFSVEAKTNKWMDVFGNLTVNGQPAEIGDEVAAFDPDGILCGVFRVHTKGLYGFLHVYGDDPATPEDEGAIPGDEITFRIYDPSKDQEIKAQASIKWSRFGKERVDIAA